MTEQERRLRRLLPGAQIRLSGSSCLPGLDPGDRDLVVLAVDVAAAAETLRSHYPEFFERVVALL